MKKLYCLRHATSPSATSSDRARPLNVRGQEEAKYIAEYIQNNNNINIDLVLCSTATRTKETLQPIEAVINGKIEYLDTLYNASTSAILHELQATNNNPDSILVICHNPGIYNFCITMLDKRNLPTIAKELHSFTPATFVELSIDINSWEELNLDVATLENVTKPAI
jgi:phosphohistidine phosphatase